jgi:hypothetical protein
MVQTTPANKAFGYYSSSTASTMKEFLTLVDMLAFLGVLYIIFLV